MMRSMFSGVSGLRTHQTKMDVIAHNISNVNTVGFKASRVTFNDVFSQTVSGASRANANTGKGGTNPMQIGLGVNVSSIDKNMGTGAAQRTDRALDMMINGDGFFIVGDASGTYFTRAGAFQLDEAGNLVMGNGMMVYGWDAVEGTDGEIAIQPDRAKPIQISGEKESFPPDTTKNIDFGGNLNALAVQSSPTGAHTSTISFYDSIGNRYVADVTMEYFENAGTSVSGAAIPANTWSYTISSQAWPNGDRTDPDNAVDIATGPPAATGLTGTFTFDNEGNIASLNGTAVDPTNATTDPILSFIPSSTDLLPAATFGGPYLAPGAAPGATPTQGVIRVDFSELTQWGNSTTNAKFDSVDGNAMGTLEGLSVGTDGIITARYTNGQMKMVGQIPVATFKNPAGLESIGNNLFVTTSNSGDFDGTGEETGDMMGGVLEMSNVDLSGEFTEMITTQRGFQASSRVITTSDEMLQELVNLKR